MGLAGPEASDEAEAKAWGAKIWGANIWGATIWGATIWGANILDGGDRRRRPAGGTRREPRLALGPFYSVVPPVGRREPGAMEHDLFQIVENLGIPHRHRDALRALMRAGAKATLAVRAGLAHADPMVRVGCCRVLDHFLDKDAVPELIENLSHPNAQVRAWALHALACDRCKEGVCRPGEDQSLGQAIRMLSEDPVREVRQQAAELVGLAVHRSPAALAAIERASRQDPHSVVRKMANWFAPGGPRYEATRPRPARKPRQRADPASAYLDPKGAG